MEIISTEYPLYWLLRCQAPMQMFVCARAPLCLFAPLSGVRTEENRTEPPVWSPPSPALELESKQKHIQVVPWPWYLWPVRQPVAHTLNMEYCYSCPIIASKSLEIHTSRNWDFVLFPF